MKLQTVLSKRGEKVLDLLQTLVPESLLCEESRLRQHHRVILKGMDSAALQ